MPDQYEFLYRRYFEGFIDHLREKIIAKRIRTLFRKGERLLHIGGWTHLIQHIGIESLASLLKDLKPEKILLS